VGQSAIHGQPREIDPGVVSHGLSLLRLVAACSGIYDIAIGVALGFFRSTLTSLFALPSPTPPIHADLNALFAIVIGIGYVLPLRDPTRYRAYLWMMGPLLKGTGALLFAWNFATGGMPASFLWFAAGDGSLAAATLWALLRTRAAAGPQGLPNPAP
jgi:hypothetical protein